MIVFNSDLDNTLIYSYKRDIGQNKKCVEIYENREISFMSDKSLEMLRYISKKILFVPLTTRTEEQYKRIFFEDVNIEYALVCNGGILLKNGKKDEIWYKNSLKLIEPYKEEMEKAEKLLENDKYRNFELRNIDNLFLFTKSSEPLKTIEYIKNNVNSKKIDVFNNGIKIYAVPKKLNKGTALERFRKYINSDFIVSAGDSVFDIPMVNCANIGFMPESMKEINNCKNINFCDSNLLFSEYILENIISIIEKEAE